jgi:hypothetical protein
LYDAHKSGTFEANRQLKNKLTCYQNEKLEELEQKGKGET